MTVGLSTSLERKNIGHVTEGRSALRKARITGTLSRSPGRGKERDNEGSPFELTARDRARVLSVETVALLVLVTANNVIAYRARLNHPESRERTVAKSLPRRVTPRKREFRIPKLVSCLLSLYPPPPCLSPFSSFLLNLEISFRHSKSSKSSKSSNNKIFLPLFIYLFAVASV